MKKLRALTDRASKSLPASHVLVLRTLDEAQTPLFSYADVAHSFDALPIAVVSLIRERVAAEEEQRRDEGEGSAPPGERVDLASAVNQQQKLDADGDE